MKKVLRKALFFIAIIGLFASGVLAGEYPNLSLNPIDKEYEVELERLNASNEFNTQLYIELELKYARLWDVELNSIYKKLLSVLEKEEQNLLRKAQRGWLQFHEKEAEFYNKVFYERSSGPVLGSLGRMEAVSKYKERIRQRTLELMMHYYNLGNDITFEYERR